MQLSEARNSVKISLAAIARQTIPPDTEVSGGIVCLEDVYLPRARSIASASARETVSLGPKCLPAGNSPF